MRIYLATHKRYTMPDDELYQPIEVGAAINSDLGYALKDNTGDNISSENRNFCELTAYYWIWKNVKDQDVVGVGHYRRIPTLGNKLFTKGTLAEELKSYDCFVNLGLPSVINYKDVFTDNSYRSMDWPNHSVYQGYAFCHKRVDIDLAWEAIIKYYPDYEKDFVNNIVFGDLFVPCNILIAPKKIFDEYCEWLFTILFYVRKYSPYKEYDEYNARVFGFLAERLQALYFVHNKYNVGGVRTIDLEDKE